MLEQVSQSEFAAELHLGCSVYPVISFSGFEAVNEPYWFTIQLPLCPTLCEDEGLGDPCALTIANPISFSTANWPALRCIYGLITEKRLIAEENGGQAAIELKLQPRLATLSLSCRPRVYIGKTVREVVRRILLHHGYLPGELEFQDARSYAPVCFPHWVQAQDETDLDFVARLLAHEGISFFWQSSNDAGEALSFVNEPFLHPMHDGELHLAEPCGMGMDSLSGLYELEMVEHAAAYEVIYRDNDRRDPGIVHEARAGKGCKKIVRWGSGAQSLSHLQRLARQHHEALVMREISYTAKSINPCLQAGFGIEVAETPFWPKKASFHIISIRHCFEKGSYQNEITFIPAEKPLRPLPVKRNIGQLVHTAVIYGDDDFPYLDKAGRYTYYTHVHDEEDEKSLQQAQRLSPYGGNAVGSAMGMHFPLHRQAEVLVMYLHNDLNQPVLQNSPPNGLNQPAVVRDNSWCVLLKTAWGQYLQFSDQKHREAVSLVSAHGNQCLHLKADDNNHEIMLRANAGPMRLQAKERQLFASENNLTVHAGENMKLEVKEDAVFQAQTLHLQAARFSASSEQSLSINAGNQLEAQAETISLCSQDEISLTADDLLQIDLPNGDILLSAKHMTLQANNALELRGNDSVIRLDDKGITIQGNTVSFASPALSVSCPVQKAAVAPVASLMKTSPPELEEVRFYPHETAKVIHPPAWNERLYHKDDTAFIEVGIEGFNGNEQGRLTLVRYHRDGQSPPLPESPAASDLKAAQPAGSQTFILGDETLYADSKDATESPGTARLRLPCSLTELPTDKEGSLHDPYYACIEIDGVKSLYTNAMIFLGKARIHLIHDKDFPYSSQDAILTLKRALPQSIRTLSLCPLPLEARYYRDPMWLQDLPAGQRNSFTLKEEGQYRELLRDDYTRPQGEQSIAVALQDDNDATLIRLMPPIIFNLRGARLEGDDVTFAEPSTETRIQLSREEIAYIEANGRNLTLFIHGYNVEHGAFSKHWQEASVKTETEAVEVDAVSGFHYPVFKQATRLKHTLHEAEATIYRDAEFLARQFPKLDKTLIEANPELNSDSFNGIGMHRWVTHLEHHLNKAAGFDGKDYRLFSRCLFISWAGNPESRLDYTKAVQESIRLGPVLARVIRELNQQISGLKLHIIAHSQGNGMLLHALNQLGSQYGELVHHAFFWQAAIPDNALSDYGLYSTQAVDKETIYRNNQHNLWFCPHAHRAAKRITVLFSKNDNVLGRLLAEKEQPPGVKLKDVWLHKPTLELTVALFIQALGLGSLYQVASWVGIPVSELLNPEALALAWEAWKKAHPVFYHQQKPYPCQETLEAQRRLLAKQHIHIEINFTEQLSDGLSEVHQLLKERFEHLDAAEQAAAISMMVASAAGAPRIARALIEILLKLLKKSLKASMLLHVVARLLKKYELLTLNLLTFMRTKVLAEGTAVREALGYKGPDLENAFINKMHQRGKLIPADTTESIWHHSDMLLGSEKIMDNVYQKWIMNKKKGINNFGQYKIQK